MNIKKQLRRATAAAGRRTIRFFRQFDARPRALPDFLIIGAQKAGTSSLYQYIAQHAQVLPSLEKEVHYFDLNYEKPIRWYKSHFPTITEMEATNSQLTGEATPYYLYHPLVPDRVKSLLPNIKLIVILRNPVDRAFSHYKHEVSRGRERLSFAEALAVEGERLKGTEEALLSGKVSAVDLHQFHSYIDRGRYTKQIENWFKHFNREQFEFLTLEGLQRDPAAAMKKVFQFLDLPDSTNIEYRVFNAGAYHSSIPEDSKAELDSIFASENQRLYELLGINLGWT